MANDQIIPGVLVFPTQILFCIKADYWEREQIPLQEIKNPLKFQRVYDYKIF
jgi:hypothetical protein